MFIKSIKSCFKKEPVNTGRQIELDIGKAVPILCLAFVHCIIECCTEEQLAHGVPYLFDMFIGGPMSAPMFMFCMGATIRYSSMHSSKRMALRGLKLIKIGVLLNICRFLIPFLIGFLITGDVDHYLIPLPYYFFGNDILQFAGLSFLCLALFVRLKVSMPALFFISVGMSVAGTFLRGTDFGNDVLNVIFGWFIGTENEAGLIISDFPLLNWLVVPVCGYIFGWLLRRVKDKKQFYLSFSPVLLVISVVCLFLGDRYEFGMFAEGENAYYHMITYDVFVCIALTLGLLGVYYAVLQVLPDNIIRFFKYISRNITAFYCIQWVFVRFITNVVLYVINGTQIFPVRGTMLISTGIVFATLAVIWIYRKFSPLHRLKGTNLPYESS